MMPVGISEYSGSTVPSYTVVASCSRLTSQAIARRTRTSCSGELERVLRYRLRVSALSDSVTRCSGSLGFSPESTPGGRVRVATSTSRPFQARSSFAESV
ncbi:hypothetical protein SCANM63S_07092 [Streptomyces canarius]